MSSETEVNQPALHSDYMLERLQSVAKSTDETLFSVLIMSVFGSHVSSHACQKLQTALCEGAIANPQYRVEAQSTSLAHYDSDSRTIWVTEPALMQARAHDIDSAYLYNALASAFGNYLYQVIKQDFTDHSQDIENPGLKQIGADYAAMMFFYGPKIEDGTVFGMYDNQAVRLTIPALQPVPIPQNFSAGPGDKPGSFGHESLEKGLASVGFTDEERRSIYFGNWLRDYSQLLDPKLVRKPDAPKNFPSKLSRSALTQLVDLLALKEFHDLQDTPEGRQAYTVVPEMLGVYRPSEHIDNPLNPSADATDPREIDSDFEPLVSHGHALLEVDAQRSLSSYIDNATSYMRQKLIDAMLAGNSIEGRRYFGEALHVLEDYFAHSNFVELCLRKRGHDVLPWTTETDCKHRLPVVTGMFGGLDVVASIAEPLGKILFEVQTLDFKRTRPGDRSDVEKVLLILLEEHQSDTPLKLLQAFLKIRDDAAESPLYGLYEAASWVAKTPLAMLQNANNAVIQGLLSWVGDNIDEFQTLSGHNPNVVPGLHPTHSQLAKDHDTHPFHDLAAYLATYAVQMVGQAMYEYWQGNTERDPASVAVAFILHPNDDNWHDDIVAAWEAMDRARTKEKIRLAGSIGDLAELQKQLEKEEQDRVRVLGESFRNAPNTVSEIIGNAFPFG